MFQLETEIKTQLKTQIEKNYKYDDLTSHEISTAWNYLFVEVCNLSVYRSVRLSVFSSFSII